MVAISPKLALVLRATCFRLDTDALAVLRGAIERGAMPWFHDELAEAIRSHQFTVDEWNLVVDSGFEPDHPSTMEDEQRFVWEELFPDSPFPLDYERLAHDWWAAA